MLFRKHGTDPPGEGLVVPETALMALADSCLGALRESLVIMAAGKQNGQESDRTHSRRPEESDEQCYL